MRRHVLDSYVYRQHVLDSYVYRQHVLRRIYIERARKTLMHAQGTPRCTTQRTHTHTHTHTRCTTQRSRKSTNENTYTYIYTYIYKYPENIDRERAAPSSLSRAQCRFLERCAAQRSRNESTFSRALCQAAPSSAVRSRNGAVRLRARENDSRTRRENRTLHSPSHCTALEKMTSDVRLVWCCYGVAMVLLSLNDPP